MNTGIRLCPGIEGEIDRLFDRFVGILADFCNLESPTSDKAGIDAASEYLAAFAEARGWKVERFRQEKAGDVWCFTMNPEANGAPIALSGHVDTVHPIGSFGTPAVRVDRDGDTVYGPGVCDCKGGIVVALYAMTVLEAVGFKDRPVMLLLQSDEEVGSRLSRKATINRITDLCRERGVELFLNFEPMGNKPSAVLSRKGILRCYYAVHGKSFHSSGCYVGRNAIAGAARRILELEKLKDPDGLTCSCNVISGGTTANTVPDLCTFTSDVRFADAEQLEYVKKLIDTVIRIDDGCTCEIVDSSERPAMPLTEENLKAFGRMNGILEAAGIEPLERKHANGGSDAAYTTIAGIPTVDSVGIIGGYIHTRDEYGRLSSLRNSALLTATVVYSY